jgi:hypothetical protein
MFLAFPWNKLNNISKECRETSQKGVLKAPAVVYEMK